jgi:hypothetical protein
VQQPRPSPPRTLTVYLDSGPRDFEITNAAVNADGTLVLSLIRKVGEKPDLGPNARHGDKIEEYESTLVAIIGPDGRLRAEGHPHPVDAALDREPIIVGGRN